MKIKTILLFIMISIILVGSVVVTSAEDTYEQPELYKGKIIELVSEQNNSIETSGGNYNQRVQIAKVELLNKGRKGEIIEIYNYIDEIMAYTIEIKEGDDVYIFFEKDSAGNEIKAHIHEFRRDKDIYFLIGIFVVLMIILGGVQGVKSLITLILTIIGIYYMLIGIVNGGNPIFLSIVISFIVTLVTMTGLGNMEAQMLLYSNHPVDFNISGILFASILLGTLGAVMDVCMSIASAINEITDANPLLSTMELFKSGMNIGRDVMGTMVNTLILAYVGTSVFLILIFMVNNIPYIDILNMDLVATEIVRALAGTIGLICAIPLTAIVAAVLEKKNMGY